MKRGAVVVLAVLVSLVLVPPAQANPPVREVIEVDDQFDSDLCGFPVEIHATGTIIRTTYTDDDGTVTRIREVYPDYRVTVTNLDTGEVFAAAIPGPQFTTFHEDGSFTNVGTGPWLFGDHPDTAEPGWFLINGRFELIVDAEGEQTFTHVGRIVDLCERLAS